jgi:hypothetical protein
MDLNLIIISSTSVLTIFTGIIILFLGYLIKYQKMVEIVTGSFSQRIRDKEGFGSWVGGHIILAGSIGMLAGSLGLIIHSYLAGLLIYVFILSLFFIISRVKNGTRKYM